MLPENDNQYPGVQKPVRRLVSSATVFTCFLLIAVTVICCFWWWGLPTHRSAFINALEEAGVICTLAFAWLTSGLYRGLKLKDTLGKMTTGIGSKLPRFLPRSGNFEFIPEVSSDSVGEFIAVLILSFLAVIITGFLLWFLGATLLFLLATGYFIFFRLQRMVLRHGAGCKGNLQRSLGYSLGYTALFGGCTYGLIIACHYLAHYLQTTL